MKKFIASLASGVILSAGVAFGSGHGVHWGYEGDVAPEFWGSLDPAYEMCSKGKNQSPIDLTGFIEAELAPIKYIDSGKWHEVINNGHSIQVNCEKGSSIEIDGRVFNLIQFHFHTPSENLINGKSFPMEAHFVHADEDGNLAVVALMFEYGDKNSIIEKIWAKMPEKSGNKNSISSDFSPYSLLPNDRDYYRFNGSLTTPPCSEGVRWFVLKKTVTVSKEQVEKFAKVMGHPNNRPIQPVNARPILK